MYVSDREIPTSDWLKQFFISVFLNMRINIVFVNDICEVVPGGVTVKLFADDTKLYSVIRNTVDRDEIQSCLTAIFEWSAHWQLNLTPSKCSAPQVSSAQVSSHCGYQINDVTLPNADSVSDLGVSYDNKLSFAVHIDKIVSKASLRSKLGSAFSKQVFETVTRGNDATVYKTRVYSARDGNYFSYRVINLWNSLPNHVVSASSVGAFKQKLQNLKLLHFIT